MPPFVTPIDSTYTLIESPGLNVSSPIKSFLYKVAKAPSLEFPKLTRTQWSTFSTVPVTISPILLLNISRRAFFSPALICCLKTEMNLSTSPYVNVAKSTFS